MAEKATFKEILVKLSEEIETFSMSDTDAWRQAGETLHELIESLPDDCSPIRKLLRFTQQGLSGIGQQKITDIFALVDGMINAFEAAGDFLSGVSDCQEKIRVAGQAIDTLLPEELRRDISEDSDHTPAPEADRPVSLDDAAVLLIEVDVDDVAGWRRLSTILATVAGGSSMANAEKIQLTDTVTLINQAIEGSTEDRRSALEKIGQQIDAMNNIDSRPVFTIVNDTSPNTDSGVSSPDETLADETRAVSEPDGSAADPEEPSDSKHDYMPEDPDMELIGEFVGEALDLIANAEESMLALETDPDDEDAIGIIFRAFHTVKGNAAFLDLTLLNKMGHSAESLLSRVRDGEIRYSGGYADLSLQSLDMIKALIQGVEGAMAGNPLTKPDDYDQLLTVLDDPEAAGINADSDDSAVPRLGDLLVAQGKVDRDQLESAVNKNPEKPVGVAAVKTKTASVKDVSQALRTQQRIKSGKSMVEQTVRIGTHRLDRLIDMVGEIVIAHSMVAQDKVVVDSNHHEFQKKINHTGKIVRELQDLSMSMRMIPLKATFQKMTRLVRDLSRKVGKDVRLVTDGEETEIDRNLVDVINDPLVHMIRNAVDHGVEDPDTRLKTGKTAHGTVRLRAYHSAGSVVVEISDDGKGLNRDQILNKAQGQGLVDPAESISDRDIYNLIFEPGFSTAKKVTEVSGRGVGMDVVKKSIESLRGQVDISSELGKGTVFKMRIPLTLAIIDGMVVRTGSENYIIPTVSIVRSIKPESDQLNTVLKTGEMLSHQGQLIPLFHLSNLFQLNGAEVDTNNTIVVVIEDENQHTGLIVDELIGRQQVVIKSLGETMQGIPGISGGAIMPNGRVGLIIDVGSLVRQATNESRMN